MYIYFLMTVTWFCCFLLVTQPSSWWVHRRRRTARHPAVCPTLRSPSWIAVIQHSLAVAPAMVHLSFQRFWRVSMLSVVRAWRESKNRGESSAHHVVSRRFCLLKEFLGYCRILDRQVLSEILVYWIICVGSLMVWFSGERVSAITWHQYPTAEIPITTQTNFSEWVSDSQWSI